MASWRAEGRKAPGYAVTGIEFGCVREMPVGSLPEHAVYHATCNRSLLGIGGFWGDVEARNRVGEKGPKGKK